MNAHVKRWMTAFVLLPIIVAIICLGAPWLFALLIMAVSVGGMWEYNRLVMDGGFSVPKVVGIIGSILCPLVFLYAGPSSVLGFFIFFVMIIFFLELVTMGGTGVINLNPLFRTSFGLLYVSVTISHFIWLRQATEGILWVFFVLVLAFSGDTAAYYVGRTFGRRKLMPKISVGKTVEGTAALVTFSTLCCGLYAWWLFPHLPLHHFLIVGFIGSILGQLGDLCESMLKRAAGVKDSSNLLPGHGGVLDRLDCLIFIVPFVYYYRQAFLS